MVGKWLRLGDRSGYTYIPFPQLAKVGENASWHAFEIGHERLQYHVMYLGLIQDTFMMRFRKGQPMDRERAIRKAVPT